MECPLRKLDALNGRYRKDPITAVGPLRCRQNAEPLIVAERVRTDTRQTGEFSRSQRIGTHDISINPRMGSRVKGFSVCTIPILRIDRSMEQHFHREAKHRRDENASEPHRMELQGDSSPEQRAEKHGYSKDDSQLHIHDTSPQEYGCSHG